MQSYAIWAQEIPSELSIKRAVILDRIENRYLELPVEAVPGNEPEYRLGDNIYSKLIDKINESGVAQVLVDEGNAGNFDDAVHDRSDPIFVQDSPVMSAKIKIKIKELYFSSGRKGNRMFSGFRLGGENEWNQGIDDEKRDEYALKVGTVGSSFAREFEDYGGARRGLELSKSFGVEALIAGIWMKSNIYRAGMGLEITVLDFNGVENKKNIFLTGVGYFADLDLHLATQGGDFNVGFRIAQRAALLKAFNKLIDSSFVHILNTVKTVPMRTKIVYADGGTKYIYGGENLGVRVGHEFHSASGDRFAVTDAYTRVSKIRCISGNCVDAFDTVLIAGAILPPDLSEGVHFVRNEIDLGGVDIDGDTIARMISGVMLPYELYRYLSYDQKFKEKNNKEIKMIDAMKVAEKIPHHKKLKTTELWKKIGMGSRQVRVAVIDSGIDYNHKALSSNIDVNLVGSDHISGDERPFDDHGHGTMVASLISGLGKKSVGIAPLTTLIPIKAFNPYGMTNSASIYSAFKEAVDLGADIIVCAWASTIKSKALYDGMTLAQSAGVLVIVSAGESTEVKEPLYPAGYQNEFNNVIVSDFDMPYELLSVAKPRGGYMKRSQRGLTTGLLSGILALTKSVCRQITPENVKKYVEKNSTYINNIKMLDYITMLDSINRDCKP